MSADRDDQTDCIGLQNQPDKIPAPELVESILQETLSIPRTRDRANRFRKLIQKNKSLLIPEDSETQSLKLRFMRQKYYMLKMRTKQ